jgi:hypothetical protein
VAVMFGQAGADEREIKDGVDAAQQVIGRNMPVHTKDVEKLCLPDLPPHHRRAPSLTQTEGITTGHRSQQRLFHRYRSFLIRHLAIEERLQCPLAFFSLSPIPAG